MIPPVLAVLVSFESGFVGTVLIMRSFSNTLLLSNKFIYLLPEYSISNSN